MYRGRRLRKNKVIRALRRETVLTVDDLILPIFVKEGNNIKEEISSMKEVYRYSIDRLDEIINEMVSNGIYTCILFGIPDYKDEIASSSYDDNGILQRAIKKIKEINNDIYIIGDVCMCEYTSHGHCGILDDCGNVLNDETLPYLQKIALSYAKCGIDMIAPSDMMDGHIEALREILDSNGYYDLPIMGYSAKYASNFYGPFRDAANSAPSFGDRKSYQMDYGNGKEAMLEIEADINEGVDIIMVKPALAFLDVIKEASMKFDLPICAYNVSGEYSMLKNAVASGLMNKDVIYESLLAIKRAGANMIITYFAIDIAKELN